MIVPSRMETYSSDILVKAKFTTNLCSQMLSRQPHDKGTRLPFKVSLDLVQCRSHDSHGGVAQQGDCQAPTDGGSDNKRVWFSKEVRNFFLDSTIAVRIKCSIWGQPGIFRIFLRTNLTHMAVVARSAPILVDLNLEYKLDSFFTAIYPCQPNDNKVITVKRPKCAPLSDKVRAYGQGTLID